MRNLEIENQDIINIDEINNRPEESNEDINKEKTNNISKENAKNVN